MILDNLDLRQILFAVSVFLIISYFWPDKRTKYNIPPGPWGIPFFGYFPFIGKEPHKDFLKLSQKYGNIFSFKKGNSLAVVLNDFDLVKEAFNNNAVLDRPSDIFDYQPDNFGFAAHNGEEWVEQRRHAMRTMKDIGLAKSGWNAILEDEVKDFLCFIEDNEGRPLKIEKPLYAGVSNNITSLTIGKRLPVGDPMRNLTDTWVDVAIKYALQTSSALFFPKFTKFLEKIGLGPVSENDRKILAGFNTFLRNLIAERKKTLKEGEEEFFIDSYMKEIEKNKANNNSFFNEKNLLGNAQALVAAGSETTKSSILWLLLIMAEYPEVQAKVQAEIDTVLGKDGKLTWLEKAKLPYTYATILEAQRWLTIVPLGLIHRTSADVKIGGYDIPKGTDVFANIWAIHNDPKCWEEPQKFRPERFLSSDGSLLAKRPDGFMPFSLGRRNCPGEIIALIEIFRYFPAMMQKFEVRMPPGKNPNFDGFLGSTYQPPSQEFVFVTRN